MMEFETFEIELPEGAAILEIAEYTWCEAECVIDADEWYD